MRHLLDRRGRPVGRRARSILLVCLIALVIFVLFETVAPLLISTVLVRDRMETAVERWIGQDVTIGGAPTLRFWPKARITLSDVTIRRDDEQKRTIGHVSELSAAFDLFGALIGRPIFKDFRLREPKIFVTRQADGTLDWSDAGLLAHAVADVRPSGNGQSLSVSYDAPIGEIRVHDGSVEINQAPEGTVTRIEGISGRVRWPHLSEGASLTGEAVVAGRKVSAEISSSQPLLLFSGRSSNTNGTIRSDLFNAQFSGIVNLAEHGFLSGNAELSTVDLPELMTWFGIDFPAADHMKALSLQAKLITSADAVRFEGLSLDINDVHATGILDLALKPNAQPRLTGTLALNRIDFSPLLAEIAPRLLDENDPAGQFRNRFDLDLRLSAQNAALGPFGLSEVAIGVMNIGAQSRVDILDSDFEGGRLTGRIGTIKEGDAGGVAARLSVHGADFATIIQRLGLQGPLPAGKGSFELAMDVARPLTAVAWRKAKGSFHFTADGGVLPGVDLANIRQLAAQKPYFSLDDAKGTGGFEFNSIDIAATLANGSADITQGRIVGASDTISLSGIVPYINSSLALSATIDRPGSDARGGNTPIAPATFFIGGSWPDPVIWPLHQNVPKLGD
ncbi:AsmA family protein [Neorhizobium alkalisoli]|nr:AsmA-like C-terminal region-containing protein [Neorhizobium alkalisoli]